MTSNATTSLVLLEQREVVRATLMRATLHLMATGDYLLLRPALQPALTRSLRSIAGKRLEGLNLDLLVGTARTSVEEAPRTFTELRGLLSGLEPDRDPSALAYLVRTHLPLVQVSPAGTWGTGGSPSHALAESWLDGRLAAPDQSLRALILRYLGAFRPASIKDVQTWSGLVRLKDSLEELKPELRILRNESGTELLDLPDAPLPPEDVPAPPRFVPEYDNLLLAQADRTRVIAEVHHSRVFLSAARVRATFLLDGFVAGTWKPERTKGSATLVIEPFEPVPEESREALLEEGERLIRFVEDDAGAFEVRLSYQ
jgi:hypothetical protein